MRAFLLVLAACAQPQAAPVPPTAPSVLSQIEASRDLDQTMVGKSEDATVAIVMASWCPHCRAEIGVFDSLRAKHPHVRWLALNYKEHEEYDGRGNAVAVRSLAKQLPWLRFVPIGDAVFAALGSPPLIPTVLVFDREGKLLERWDRRDHPPPAAAELDPLLP